jgi:hypothetical protein
MGDSPNQEGQVPVFVSFGRVAHLYSSHWVHFSLTLTTHRATMEVFEPTSTREDSAETILRYTAPTGPHRKRLFHYFVFSRSRRNNVSRELFLSNGCFTVAYLHSCYLSMGPQITISNIIAQRWLGMRSKARKPNDRDRFLARAGGAEENKKDRQSR